MVLILQVSQAHICSSCLFTNCCKSTYSCAQIFSFKLWGTSAESGLPDWLSGLIIVWMCKYSPCPPQVRCWEWHQDMPCHHIVWGGDPLTVTEDSNMAARITGAGLGAGTQVDFLSGGLIIGYVTHHLLVWGRGSCRWHCPHLAGRSTWRCHFHTLCTVCLRDSWLLPLSLLFLGLPLLPQPPFFLCRVLHPTTLPRQHHFTQLLHFNCLLLWFLPGAGNLKCENQKWLQKFPLKCAAGGKSTCEPIRSLVIYLSLLILAVNG